MKATGSATYFARGRNSFVLVMTGLVASILLAGCGGGAATTENPLTQAPPPGTAAYAGPAARDPDVLRFQQEFWANVKTADRCGNCHNESVGQLPTFARNDDVNLAYDEALTVVDATSLLCRASSKKSAAATTAGTPTRRAVPRS